MSERFKGLVGITGRRDVLKAGATGLLGMLPIFKGRPLPAVENHKGQIELVETPKIVPLHELNLINGDLCEFAVCVGGQDWNMLGYVTGISYDSSSILAIPTEDPYADSYIPSPMWDGRVSIEILLTKPPAVLDASDNQ